MRYGSIVFGTFVTLLLVTVGAHASDEEPAKNEPSCKNILQFPKRSLTDDQNRLLPAGLQSVANTPALKHLWEVATKARVTETKGEKMHVVSLEAFSSSKLVGPSDLVSTGRLRIPQDLLTFDEMMVLRPRIQAVGLESVFNHSFEIPMLRVYPIPRIQIESFSQVLGATADGNLVFLEHLPVPQLKRRDVNDRASACFVLAGLKMLSDNLVLPKLLGVTELEDGTMMAVFPVPVGYQRPDLASVRMGIEIAMGRRSPTTQEPLAQEVARISRFEALIDRLVASEWPLLNYSVNLEGVVREWPEIQPSAIVDRMKLPLWEFRGNQVREPFFYPSYFAFGTSPWFPAAFSPWARRSSDTQTDGFVITAHGRRLSRLIRIPLVNMDPISRFGRITLLRWDFFQSLLNGQAKIRYLDMLRDEGPQAQQSLLELIEFLAFRSRSEKLLKFCSNYRAKKYREAFQVIGGASE